MSPSNFSYKIQNLVRFCSIFDNLLTMLSQFFSQNNQFPMFGYFTVFYNPLVPGFPSTQKFLPLSLKSHLSKPQRKKVVGCRFSPAELMIIKQISGAKNRPKKGTRLAPSLLRAAEKWKHELLRDLQCRRTSRITILCPGKRLRAGALLPALITFSKGQ